MENDIPEREELEIEKSDPSLQPLFTRRIFAPAELDEVCANLYSQYLQGRSVAILLLEGELGAGKTAFCQSLGRVLGIEANINSPTFNLLNEYEGREALLYHYDLYRISAPEEVEDIGFPDRWSEKPVAGAKLRVHAVEWWRRAEKYFPRHAAKYLIKIEYSLDDDSMKRTLSIYRHVG